LKRIIGSHGSEARNTDLYDREKFPDEGVEGRFGRIFPVGEGYAKDGKPKLRPHPSPRYDLTRLGAAEGPMGEGPRAESLAPAGMTFLGQFIDHDITLDVQSKFEKPEINFRLENARTPNLDLDCVYGGGREASPHLYADAYLIEGEPSDTLNGVERSDLPRNAVGRALIGDPRNDENVLVSQIQASFIRFHNRSVDVIRRTKRIENDDELFERARDTTIHYYHRLLLEDFLFHVIGSAMIHSIASDGRKFYLKNGFWSKKGLLEKPFMPVEFSVAAYRYGHSQVRDEYKINDKKTLPLFSDRENDDKNPLSGFQPLPSELVVDWDNFFSLPGLKIEQCAFKIDPFLPPFLLALPKMIVGDGGVISLATRNLLRGRTFRLPSGEEIARRMIEQGCLDHDESNDPAARHVNINGDESYSNEVNKLLKDLRTDYAMKEIPLWLYILLEADIHGRGFSPDDAVKSSGGDRLGPVGGRIVGEVLMGLLDHYRDMSGKGLDHSPDVPYRFDGDPQTSDSVLISETKNFGPRMSMRAFIDFAYGACLTEPDKVRGKEAPA